ncbi:hypothetical protein ACIGQE_15395 [Streptomyces sp. NPDC053429]|uniref:hypothetical protein n=1 Tax=Streptomyces sp. NPDC053429 TaxID=3365702 RepID=UPI0037D1D661
MKTKTLPRSNASALALREDALDPFDADQRTRVPAAAGLAAVTPLPAPMPQLTPRAVRVLAGLEKAKQGQPQNYCDFLDVMAQEIRKAGDSKAVLAEVAGLLAAMRTAGTAK